LQDFCFITVIAYAEKVELLNFIPAWFMGTAVFFALSFMHKTGTMSAYVEIAEQVKKSA